MTVTFNPAVNFAVGVNPVDVEILDFNGDGNLDIITPNANSDDVSLLLGDGAGGFAPATNFAVGNTPGDVAIADVNGDGNLDLVTANSAGVDGVSILLGDGAGNFDTAMGFETVGTGSNSVAIADLNGDGRLDLVTASFGGNNVSILINSSNTIPTITTAATVSIPENQTAVIDINATDDTDSEGAGLTYSLSDGADQGLFNLDATTGVLSFAAPQDFENPGDTNTDNNFIVQVTVTNSVGSAAIQDLTISVTDLDENAPITLIGSDYPDTLIGGSENDFLNGLARNDSLSGLGGNDTILGGNGVDTLDGGDGNDSLDGGASNDQLLGGEGDDTLLGNAGRDTLDGGVGSDSLDGGTSDDELLGGEGDDTLLGGTGRDTLNGGIGSDLITGGSSPDTFVLTAGEGTDTITDFGTGNDVIGLSDGLTFADLSFVGNDIIFGAETLATLSGIDTTTLNSDDFLIV